MDTLVIGIDGGDERIIRNMDMPFLNEKLQEMKSYDITEDLWSRGWASILNGLHGRETGAFYCKPSLDGDYGFTQSFGTPGHEAAPTKPLWEIAMDNGYTVGMMNPPTTVPAPEVDGFFVSGAGGGYSPAGGIPEAACHPNSILETLEDHNCRWETRFTSAGIHDMDEFFREVEDTVNNRVDAYLDLYEEYQPDFGFFVHKELVVIQNLMMYEIESLINSPNETDEVEGKIKDLYLKVDKGLSELVSNINPSEVIVVSDHGQSHYTHTVNLNAFLKDIGVQSSPSTRLPRAIVRTIGRDILPNGIQKIIKDRFPGTVESVVKPDVDWENSLAFNFRYIPGIYVNDEHRFDGPVKEEDVGEVVNAIIGKFNNHQKSERENLYATKYRGEFNEAIREEVLPDIWIENPETVFFEQHGEFIRNNPRYGPVNNLNDVDQDFYTGVKGEKPILWVENGKNVDLNSSDDLSLAYDIISEKLTN